MYLLYLMSSSGPDLAQVRSGQAWSVESSQVRLKIVQCFSVQVAGANNYSTSLSSQSRRFGFDNKWILCGYDFNFKDFSVSADFKVHFMSFKILN